MLGSILNKDLYKKLDLEGRLILLSGHSNSSRKMADDIYKVFEQDHEMGKRAVRLDVKRLPYSNGDQNFEIRDPDERLNCNEIKELLRNGDTYLISKLENPDLANPLKYNLDPIIGAFGREYRSLKLTTKNQEEFEYYFKSYITSNIPVLLKGIVKKKTLENNIISIANYFSKIFNKYDEEVMEVFKDANHKGDVDLNDSRLDFLKDTLSGYLHRKKIVEESPKQIFYDELREISERIGQEVLNENTKGRLNWITPWLDGRSDHTNVNPFEGIRALGIAKLAHSCDVKNVQMIRAHSKKQIDFFEERGINVYNLTQTNEYISLLGQDFDSFKDVYILSPDEGGMADAMVFARELYRRTNGEFNGRVVVFKKKRITAGKIKQMEFKASYNYDTNKERKKDLLEVDGKPIPYDKQYADTFKNPDSKDYIKRLFKLEFGTEEKEPEPPKTENKEEFKEFKIVLDDYKQNLKKEENKLIKRIKGHYAIIRDDIVGSASTILRSSKRANETYNSPVLGLIEHASLTGDAIKNLDKHYSKGILSILYTSTSIVHPGNRPWHIARSMSNRFKGYTKNLYMPWLKENWNNIYNRVTKLSIKRL